MNESLVVVHNMDGNLKIRECGRKELIDKFSTFSLSCNFHGIDRIRLDYCFYYNWKI